MNAPQPFDQSDFVPGARVPEDPHDKIVPPDTFISDFVLATKGISASTRLTTWAALFLISCVLKRDAWIAWVPDALYGNLFVIFVSELPRWQAKSTIIDSYVDVILREFSEIPGWPPDLRARKLVKAFHSKITPEALFDQLSKPTMIPVLDEKGNPIPGDKPNTVKMIKGPSNAALIMSELGTFLSKAKYNENLIQRLTDLYSCKSRDDETTKKDGTLTVNDTYVTLLGATTQEALDKYLPEAATADGFLSRTIVIQSNGIARDDDEGIPFEVIQDNPRKRLWARLAWIAANCNGEYTLSPEAEALYRQAYKKLVHWTKTHPDRKVAAIKSRLDLHILRVAMLIRASHYDTSREITAEDFRQATEIVEDSFKHAPKLLSQIHVSPDVKARNDLREYLEYRGPDGVIRKDLISRFSSKHGRSSVPARMLSVYLRDLLNEGAIEIWNDGQKSDRILEHTREKYVWVQEQQDGKTDSQGA